jgi:hypothetical protein
VSLELKHERNVSYILEVNGQERQLLKDKFYLLLYLDFKEAFGIDLARVQGDISMWAGPGDNNGQYHTNNINPYSPVYLHQTVVLSDVCCICIQA